MDLFHEYFINVEPQKEMWPYKQFLLLFCCCSCCCCLRFLTHVLSYIAKLNLNWHRKAAEVVIFGSHRNVSLSWLSLLFHKFLRSNKILVIFPNGVDLHHMVEVATEYILRSKCSFLGLYKLHAIRSFQLMMKTKDGNIFCVDVINNQWNSEIIHIKYVSLKTDIAGYNFPNTMNYFL